MGQEWAATDTVISTLEAKGFGGHPVSVSAVQRRRAQAGAGTLLQISYVVACGSECDSLSSTLADMSTGASGTAFATAIIDAITSAAAASGFDNVVLSTPADVAASITVPDTVTITLPPAPTPPTPPTPPSPPSGPVDPGDVTDCPADQAGYAFDGPAFFDISTTGTAITEWGQNPDDGFFEVPLGFTMPWFGLNEDVIHVGTNGYITFGVSHFAFGSSEPFPGDPTGPVDGVIGVYWADINPDPAANVDGAGVFYQAFGADSMVVQWNNVVYWTSNNDPTTNTFQATLFPSGGFILAYGMMNDATGTLSWSTESIGYESQDGLEGVQISYDVVPDSNTAYYVPPVCTLRSAVPPPPPPPPATGCTSSLSCDELGALYGGAWRTTTDNFLRGSDQVCGESDTGFLGDDGDLCFGGQVAGGADTQLFAGDSWGHAGSICMAIGSRLCTVAELQAEETRGTGCEHDNEWVWAAEACDGGHMTAVGGNHNGQNRCTDTGECEAGQNPCTCDARCTPDTTHEAVRCCADVDPSIGETCLTVGYTTGCSALSCDELGALYGGAWRTTDANFLRGSDQVCGESDNGFNTDGTNLCFGGQVGGGADTFIDSWGHAASICMAIGSRLCTVAELQAEETRGTGCDHDNEWVWAAEACDGGHMTAVGGNHNGQNRCVDTGECEAGQNPCTCTARCTADATPEAVRCCADVAGQLCNAPPPSAPDVTVMSASAAGMTTVQLTFSLDASMANVYAMAGTDDEVMAFPAAFQVDAPFGTDIGGVPAAFIAVSADAAFDSWLTIGVTDGSAGATLAASPGLGLGDWSETAGISETNGAIFFMNPADGPAGDDIVLAQITSATPTGTASAKLQGRSADGSADWSAYKEWAW